ncbi:MAG TPA: sulfate ABC transporter substrate-binding protein [Polyangiaceae bacterium]|nr:sulfate ABC transporter substrate-binding protein [Polyangiaceae bacterium]
MSAPASRAWLAALAVAATLDCRPAAKELALLNVSYDPTRELYADFNVAFARHQLAQTGEVVNIKQSHGGSGTQARAVIDGLEADVVTLAIEQDVNAISQRGLIDAGWKQRLPFGSAPYSSTIVLLVRGGNPKQIHGWDDLARDGVAVITPNPKTGGGARLNYLAAWAHGLRRFAGDEQATRDFVARIYQNVAVLDSGARGAATTFVERGIGDVLIAWENEAELTLALRPKGEFEVVVPSVTLLAEPTVAVVDGYAKQHGTEALARAYLEYLYSPEGQAIIEKHHFRARPSPATAAGSAPAPATAGGPILVRVDDLGGWDVVQRKHFGDGGLYDHMQKRP